MGEGEAMTYAEAVKLAAYWLDAAYAGDKDVSEFDLEALAVLRRAEKVMAAVEKAETFTTENGLVRFSLFPQMKAIIEAALAHREAKESK